MKRRRAPKPWHAYGVVGVLSVAPYLYTLGFDFTYDDHHHFVQNEFVQDLGNLAKLWPTRYFGQELPDQGRPVLVLSEFLDRALGGSAGVCHLQSALWHAAVAMLVTALASSLGLSLASGVAAGLVFGLHPVLVEAVAGISNREDLLATAFVLLALLAVKKSLARPGWLAAAGFAFALALGSKENAIALPGLVLLFAACSSRYRPTRDARKAWLRLGGVLAVVALAWAAFQLRLGYPSLLPGAGGTGLERATIAAPVPLVRAVAAWQSAPTPEPRAPAEPPRARKPQGDVTLADGVALEAFRAWQLVIPWPTAPEYDLTPFRSPLSRFAGALALGLLAAAAWRDFARSQKLTLGIGWFAIATVPVAVPTLLLNPLADRYLYMPAVGFALLAGYWLGTRLPELTRRPDATGWGLTFLGLGYFALLMTELPSWRDDASLFSKAVVTAPRSARAHLNLGSALLNAKRFAEAERELDRAFELDPSLIAAPFDLGILAEQRGAPDLAIERYSRALATEPLVAELPLRNRACERLGTLLIRRGRLSEARALVERETARDAESPCAAEVGTRLDSIAPGR